MHDLLVNEWLGRCYYDWFKDNARNPAQLDEMANVVKKAQKDMVMCNAYCGQILELLAQYYPDDIEDFLKECRDFEKTRTPSFVKEHLKHFLDELKKNVKRENENTDADTIDQQLCSTEAELDKKYGGRK